MMKVLTVVGTRPEVIRLSRVIPLLDESFEHVLVHTGQNSDFSLRDVFFRDLGLRAPDYSFNVSTTSLGSMLAEILALTEEVLEIEHPDAFLVLGDTNSSLSALIAKRMRVPVYHMEAGNRCFDENVPEETNRRIVDHLADFNLAYTEHARRNLLAEGIEPRRILVTGSPLGEVLQFYRDAIDSSTVLQQMAVQSGEFVLVSAHRQENVDDPARLASLFLCLEKIVEEMTLPLLVSTHPRTRQRLEERGLTDIKGVQFHEPFGFLDYCHLQANAYCVVSDSGTVSEEASILGFPAVTLRSSIERPEALDAGRIIMTDLEPVNVVQGIRASVRHPKPISMPENYDVLDSSVRIRNFIMSTASEHKFWSGLR